MPIYGIVVGVEIGYKLDDDFKFMFEKVILDSGKEYIVKDYWNKMSELYSEIWDKSFEIKLYNDLYGDEFKYRPEDIHIQKNSEPKEAIEYWLWNENKLYTKDVYVHATHDKYIYIAKMVKNVY